LDGILYFNEGKNSGSSQDHKHIQILPSEAKKLPLYVAIADYLKDKRQAEI
jgi:ATP adenylyltransferase/5',5'''-P-1,P-4-tetraphosphate phosphorylase II